MTARNHRRHPGTAFSSNSDAFAWQLKPANCSPYNRTGRPVRAENLDSAILVMKAAENRSRCDGAEPLNRPMNGSVLAQSSMSPRSIIVGDKLAKDPAQMGLTEHNQVVETFPSDRANQSLRVPILPRRARSNRFVADTHGA